MDTHVYPYWMHHATKPSVMVTTEEERAALPDGYRYDPFTPDELAYAAEQALQPPPATPPHASGSAPVAEDFHDMPGDPPAPRRR
jgi:hypothetical protein